MHLSWLWQLQGKRDEACQPLADVYGWFTQGFDTADLRELLYRFAFPVKVQNPAHRFSYPVNGL